MSQKFLATAIIMLGLAVAIGAFGAHGLEHVISEKYRSVFETGVRYQFYNSLGLGLLALAMKHGNENTRAPWWIIFAGMCIFCISLYILSLNQVLGESLKLMGAIAPIGGSLMVLGWIWAGIKIWRNQ